MSEIPRYSDNTNFETEDLADTKPETVPAAALPAHSPAVTLQITAALRSDVGAVRETNEDSCLSYTLDSTGHEALPPGGLYIVADGMGGYHGGERASRIASRTAAHYVLEHIYFPLFESNSEPDAGSVTAGLRAAVLAAHKAVHPQDYAGNGGTTLTLALVLGRRVYLAHVGDSRAYWLVGGQLQTLTHDHSLVQRLQDEGKLTAEEAQTHQYRNVLLRALGQEEELEVDTYRYDLPASGKLLLCSDGLCGLVSDDEILAVMREQAPPADIADQLIAAALKAGGTDNISAIVVDFSY